MDDGGCIGGVSIEAGGDRDVPPRVERDDEDEDDRVKEIMVVADRRAEDDHKTCWFVSGGAAAVAHTYDAMVLHEMWRNDFEYFGDEAAAERVWMDDRNRVRDSWCFLERGVAYGTEQRDLPSVEEVLRCLPRFSANNTRHPAGARWGDRVPAVAYAAVSIEGLCGNEDEDTDEGERFAPTFTCEGRRLGVASVAVRFARPLPDELHGARGSLNSSGFVNSRLARERFARLAGVVERASDADEDEPRLMRVYAKTDTPGCEPDLEARMEVHDPQTAHRYATPAEDGSGDLILDPAEVRSLPSGGAAATRVVSLRSATGGTVRAKLACRCTTINATEPGQTRLRSWYDVVLSQLPSAAFSPASARVLLLHEARPDHARVGDTVVGEATVWHLPPDGEAR